MPSLPASLSWRSGESTIPPTFSKYIPRTPTFGPQPWLALRTVGGTYHSDNFDIDIPFHKWQYVFDEETFPLSALNAIGVAANNAFGTTTVAVMNPANCKRREEALESASVSVAAASLTALSARGPVL